MGLKPCPHQQQCRSNVRLCRINIRFCRKNRSTCSIRQCCFDIIASVNGALGCWTSLSAAKWGWDCTSRAKSDIYDSLVRYCGQSENFSTWKLLLPRLNYIVGLRNFTLSPTWICKFAIILKFS